MSTINNEVKQEILAKIKAGEEVKKIATQYGVSDRTIYIWLKKGVVNNISVLELGKLKKENQILKEIVGVLTMELEKVKKREARSVFYQWLSGQIKIKLDSCSLKTGRNQILRLLGVAKSVCFYQSKRISKDEEMKNKILSILSSNPAYGHRRMALALGVGRKRVRRVMKCLALSPTNGKPGGESDGMKDDRRQFTKT